MKNDLNESLFSLEDILTTIGLISRIKHYDEYGYLRRHYNENILILIC